MFENLSDRLERSFKILKGEGQITEINVASTLKDVRRALLDADVNFKAAKDAVTQALTDAYVGRRDKKGTMRSLWIARLNAAVRDQGLSYSRFIDGLTKAQVIINRKALSNMAIEDPEAFKAVVETAKKAIGA